MRTLSYLRTLLGCVFLSTNVALATPVKQAEHSDDPILRFAASLRNAIIERRAGQLEAVARLAGGASDQAVLNWIYDDEYVQTFMGPESKSLYSLLSSEDVGIVYQGGIEGPQSDVGGILYIVYYYTINEVRSPEYTVFNLIASGKFMTDFAACYVQLHDKQLLLRWSFCLNETEKP